MKKILVLHGPNLNLLGHREPEVYGNTTLQMLHDQMQAETESSAASLSCFQSNSESELIEHIHQAMKDEVNYIIFNPAAFTHTSIALRDAIAAAKIPFIEIHISNIYNREPFRQHSYFSDLASGVICGFGVDGYLLALKTILSRIKNT